LRLSDAELIAHMVDEPPIHCFDGKRLVLAFIERTALTDYFRTARRPGMRLSNLIVDRNLKAFARVVTAKYSMPVSPTFGHCRQPQVLRRSSCP
jgi:hypothetical protein